MFVIGVESWSLLVDILFLGILPAIALFYYIKKFRATGLVVLLIFSSVYVLYYFIGSLIDVDLNAITISRNPHSMTLNFLGIFLLIGTSILLIYALNAFMLWKHRKKLF